MKKFFRIALINISILLVLIILLEVVLRIFNIGYGNEPLENDRILHHKHPPAYNFISYTPSKEYGGHSVKYDTTGNRVPDTYNHDPKKKAFWFLGDSFTAAIQVSWENSYVGQIESLFKSQYSGINFGISSYSPLLYVIQLKKYLPVLPKPEIVFIQLYSNDVSDDENYQGSTKFDTLDEPIACDGGETNLVTRMLRKLYIARTVRKIQLIMKYRKENSEKSSKKMTDLQLQNYIEQVPLIDSNGRFAKSILQIDRLLNNMNIRHYFFAIPSKYSTVSGNWNVETFSKNFAKFAEQERLPVINFEEAVKTASKTQKLFYDVDIHCNENGNKLIAQELYKAVVTDSNYIKIK